MPSVGYNEDDPEELYAEQQRQLADSPEIDIEVPRDPEVNQEVYRDTESILFRGFLTVGVEINGVYFIFKSLNHHEYELLQFTSGVLLESSSSKERYYNTFLAQGVFMVEGENFLIDRPKKMAKLIETFSQFPLGAKQKLVKNLSELNAKASRAVALTEAFAMENSSRYRWAQLRGLDLMSSSVTGIDGTERLGLNWGQLVWRALNFYEDQRELAEREWDNAKFIGSCLAGKGIQKIYNQDKERRKKEKEERWERKDKLIRQIRFREPEDAPDVKGGVVKIVARTVEELTEQLKRDLKGEKDWHDEVVAAEESRIAAAHRARKKQLEDLAASRLAEDGERSNKPYSTTYMQGLSREQVMENLQRKRQMDAQQAASRMVYPELDDPRLSSFLDKYHQDDNSSYETGVKTSITETDRDTDQAHPVTPTKPRGTPFRR